MEALRNGDSFIPELSLVAEENGTIVGHILFTKARVGTDEVLALAPLSVKPEYQKKGIGTALILEGHRIAKNLGYSHSLVLGSDAYYPRFGYRPATCYHIQTPDGIPENYFMAIALQDHPKEIGGEVTYAREFGM